MTIFSKLGENLIHQVAYFLTTLDRYILGTTCKEIHAFLAAYPKARCSMLDAAMSLPHFHFAWNMPNFPVACPHRCIDAAALVGNLDVLQHFAHEINDVTVPQKLLEIAIPKGHLHVVTWLCTNYQKFLMFNYRVAELSALCGNLEMIKMFHQKGLRVYKNAITAIMVERMDTTMLTWALSVNFPFSPRQQMVNAAIAGNITRMQWLLTNNFCTVRDCGNDIVTLLATTGNLNAAKLAHEFGFPTDFYTLYMSIPTAISHGDLMAADWLFHVVGRHCIDTQQLEAGDEWHTPFLRHALFRQEPEMATWIMMSLLMKF